MFANDTSKSHSILILFTGHIIIDRRSQIQISMTDAPYNFITRVMIFYVKSTQLYFPFEA